MIDDAILAEADRLDVGPAGNIYLDLIMNPTRDGMSDDKSIVAPVPDGKGANCVFLCLTARHTFSGATATTGYITPLPPSSTLACAIHVFYGGDVTSPASSPTAISYDSGWNERTPASAFISSTSSYRIVAMGLKVHCSSSAAVAGTPGIFVGGLTSRIGQASAVPAFNTYASFQPYLDTGSNRTASEGMTVRSLVDNEMLNFTATPVNLYGAATALTGFGRRPMIFFTGIAADSTLAIESNLYVEVAVSPQSCPIPVLPPIYEDEFPKLLAFANSQQYITSGNSFKSFIKSVGKIASQTFRFINKNKSIFTPVAKLIMG
jgi:hypothetical protein